MTAVIRAFDCIFTAHNFHGACGNWCDLARLDLHAKQTLSETCAANLRAQSNSIRRTNRHPNDAAGLAHARPDPGLARCTPNSCERLLIEFVIIFYLQTRHAPATSSAARTASASRSTGNATRRRTAAMAPMRTRSSAVSARTPCTSHKHTHCNVSLHRFSPAGNKVCTSEEFTCKSNEGECIPLTWVCDETSDCTDGSDETNCSK